METNCDPTGRWGGSAFSDSWPRLMLPYPWIASSEEDRIMKLHSNAQTCPRCRYLIASRVLHEEAAATVARDFHITTKTALKWATRFRAEGANGLADKSSRSNRIARLAIPSSRRICR